MVGNRLDSKTLRESFPNACAHVGRYCFGSESLINLFSEAVSTHMFAIALCSECCELPETRASHASDAVTPDQFNYFHSETCPRLSAADGIGTTKVRRYRVRPEDASAASAAEGYSFESSRGYCFMTHWESGSCHPHRRLMSGSLLLFRTVTSPPVSEQRA